MIIFEIGNNSRYRSNRQETELRITYHHFIIHK